MPGRHAFCVISIALSTFSHPSATWAQHAPPHTDRPRIEIRLADIKESPGFRRRPERLAALPRNADVFLDTTNVVSHRDIREARTHVTPDGLGLDVILSEAAATRLRETTGRNVGRYIAVVVNGRLALAALIMGATPAPGTRNLSISLELPPGHAQELRADVAARWPNEK